MLWLGYRRVSRVGGRENLISPELQAKRIESYASLRGWEVRMLEPELDVSGGKRKRPILDYAIGEVREGRAAGVIVSQLDRLSRMRMVDALAVIEDIEGVGGQVVAVAENVDPTTPEGRMARNVFLSFAAMQRERNAVAVAEAKQRAVEAGIWPMPLVPKGYVKGPDRRLVPGPEAPKVREVFRRRAQGESWESIGRFLGVGPSSVRRIVTNRTYLGEITVGEWHNPTAHPPLVSRAEWEAAQHEFPSRPRSEGEWLLKGLVRCAHCQRTMISSEGAYRCLRRGGCPKRTRTPWRRLDAVAVAILFDWARGAAYRTTDSTDRDGLVADLERAEAELRAYQEATAALGNDGFADGLRTRLESVRAAQRALAEVRPASALPSVDVEALWPAMNVDDRRHVLGSLLGVVWVWDRERYRFVARGFEPEGLSRPGRKAPEVSPVEDTDLVGELRVVAGGDAD